MRIASKVNNGQVFISCSDVLKSLYADLAETENPDVKNYIKGNIELWEIYEGDILKQVNNRY
jgi:hypothetical protein